MRDRGRLGLPRPLTEGGKGPLGVNRPLVEEQTVADMLHGFIEDEKKADREYFNLIFKLRERGMDSAADTVESIREDELRHQEQFRQLLERVQ